MIKVFVKIFLLSILTLCFFSFSQIQAEVAKPVISLTNVTVTQGNNVGMTLRISGQVPYSALDISILYDTTHFKASSFSYSSLFNGISHQKEAVIDSNHQLSYVFISASNVTLSGDLLYIQFSTVNDAPIDTFVVYVGVNGVFDEALVAIDTTSQNGSITFIEKVIPIKSANFSRSISKTQLRQDETFTFTISSSNLALMAASNFELIFNHNHIEFVDVSYGTVLRASDVLIDLNTNTRGLVLIAFAKTNGINQASPLLTFTFKVIADIDVTSELIFQSKNTVDINFSPIQTNIITQNITLIKKEVVVILPNMRINSYVGTVNTDFYVDVILEKKAALSAGDFQITFDHEILTYDHFEVLTEKGFFIFNYREQEQKMTFSFIDSDGLDEERVLRIHFKAKASSPLTTQIQLSGSNLVDKNLNRVNATFSPSIVEFRNGFGVTFKDFDDSILSSSLVLIDTLPVMPEISLRLNTSFKGWDEIKIEGSSDLIYKAQYELEMENIIIENKKVMYSSEVHELDVLNLPEGAKAEFSLTDLKDAGTYIIEVSLYLDDVLQEKVTKELIIESKPIEISFSAFEMTLYLQIPEFTFTHNGLYDGDDLNLSFNVITNVLGTHVLNATSNNPNYIVTVNPGTLNVLDFPYAFGDVNQDQVISIMDAAFIQLYLLDLITLTEAQIALSDVNRDNKIDLKDIAMIQLIIANLIESPQIQLSALKLPKLSRLLSPPLQSIQLSSLTFEDQTFIYDGSYKTIEVQGDLPLGVKSVTYGNPFRKDAGSQFVFARFEVEEGYVKPNDMVAKITILKASLDIPNQELIVFYDPLKTYTSLSDIITPHFDTIKPSFEPFSFHLPGTYQINAIYDSPNYEYNEITHTLTIKKRAVIISSQDVTYIKTSHSIKLNNLNRMLVAFEDGPFENILEFESLKRNYLYKIYVYIEESDLDQMSNMIEMFIKTYDSIDDALKILNEKEITLFDVDILLELTNRLKDINPEEYKDQALQLETHITSYNALVQNIVSEYKSIESIIPTQVETMIGLGVWTWLLLKKRY